MRLLIVYSTIDGHTLEICERIAQLAREAGHEAELAEVEHVPVERLEACDRIVIGASIRYGRHRPAVSTFIDRHQAALEARPNAFFSVNAVGRKPHKRQPDTNPYVRKFLRQIRWKPQQVEVFGGKVDYPRYGFFERHMIRLIMWITGGPTDPRSVTDFTDWAQVEAFARRVMA
ncbi:menaquinone-dependent protoporphyrinogen IX dehydrogenase [Thauera sp. WH-1]|uniref:menaquinone-dependent protoporphyrinogen IX dehydrogenase n=1 Tax=Thauera sp. WH-1 TaxID=3398230 RepID=UPI0039FD1EB4